MSLVSVVIYHRCQLLQCQRVFVPLYNVTLSPLILQLLRRQIFTLLCLLCKQAGYFSVSCSSTVYYWHCSHSRRSSSVRRVCCWTPCGPEISIASRRCSQQHIRAVPRWQLTQGAENRLVWKLYRAISQESNVSICSDIYLAAILD